MDGLRDDLEELHKTFATARPSARLAAIRQRLARNETASPAQRLITLLAGIEALSRSLVVHAPGRPPATAHIRYQQVRSTALPELVEEAFRLHGTPSPADAVGASAWEALSLAHECRELLVHECGFLPQERYAPLVSAADQVLDALVVAGGLLRVVPAARVASHDA
jgi:hypothetical protein